MEFEKIINSVGKAILWTSYEHFFASVLMAFLFTFAYRYFKQHGAKKGFVMWVNKIRKDKELQKAFIMAFVVAMLLYETLLCRISFVNPFNDVWGSWNFKDKNGEFNSGNIQNICLFIIPMFMILLLYGKKIFKNKKATFWRVTGFSLIASFVVSVSIELIQVFMFLGMFQFSDLCYNILGGMIGGFLYYIFNLIRRYIYNAK